MNLSLFRRVNPESRHWLFMLTAIPLVWLWLAGEEQEPWLSTRTAWHYMLALGAAVLFLKAIPTLFGDSRNDTKSLLGVFVFTGGVGMLVLHGIHWLAEKSRHSVMDGTLDASFFWHLIRLIDMSNTMVEDERASLPARLFACTVGIGLPEEFVKAIPVCFVLVRCSFMDWKDSLLVGLVSGAGFGVAEGIAYSERYYNGVSSFMMYATRFISCVGLHVAWSGIAAVLIERKRKAILLDENVVFNIVMLLFYISPMMIVHGLYDSLLYSDMPGGAVVTAILSLALLSLVIHRHQSAHEAATRREALSIIRSKIAAGGMDSLTEDEFRTLQRARRKPRSAKSRTR